MAVNIDLLNANSVTNINTNFNRVEEALQDVVGRSGIGPNQMEADLDMNSNDILNVNTIQANDITIDGSDPQGLLERALEAVLESEDNANAAAISATNAANSVIVAEAAASVFPLGGMTGQVLTKSSNVDYDTIWVTPSVGGGGTSVFLLKSYIEADSPSLDPDVYLLSGNLVSGDLGEIIHLFKVGSEPTHDGKIQNGNGIWYEIDRNRHVNPFFFVETADAGDHSLAFSRAADTIIAFGGGEIRYPEVNEILEWNTAVTKTFGSRSKITVDFGNTKIQLGSELFLGGLYELTSFLSLQGQSSVDITSNVSAFYTNYLQLNTDVSDLNTRAGDRIYISDTVNTWAGGDARHCHFTVVDYVDETNNIINFYPGISIPVTISNATTGQISPTNLIVTLYNKDMDIKFKGGNFYGLRHPIGSDPGTPGQVAGGTSPFGMTMKRGRGSISGTNFYDLCTSLSLREGSWRYSDSENVGSYNGYGVKLTTRCEVWIDNVVMTGSRHALGVGGSEPDGAIAWIANSVVGGSRQSRSNTIYPSEEFGAFDLHPSAYAAYATNCKIIGGITHDNGILKIVGGKIITRQLEGICQFVGNGTNNGVFSLLDVDIEVHPRTPAFDDGGGTGTFGSVSALFREQTFTSSSTGWKFYWKGGTVTFPRSTSWGNPTDFAVNISSYLWDHIEINGVTFAAEANVRRIIFNGRGDGTGRYHILNCKFDNTAILVFNEPLLNAWQALFIEDNEINNIGTLAAATAIDISGDTSATGPLQDIIVNNNHIQSLGATSFISMSSSARRMTVVNDNTCIYVAAGGTMTYAIRTHRNQNATNMWMRAISQIRRNKIISRGASMSGPNTIGTGIQILGLAAAGGLSAGTYNIGDNIIESVTTPSSVTGTAATVV